MQNLRQGGFLISKIHQLSGRIFARMLRNHQININPAQGRILFVLWMEDNITIHDLAFRTGLGKSTLTRMLDRMQASGLVVKRNSPDDRRIILIGLGEENVKLKASYQQVSLEMSDLFYRGFSSEEIGTFESHLERILKNLPD